MRKHSLLAAVAMFALAFTGAAVAAPDAAAFLWHNLTAHADIGGALALAWGPVVRDLQAKQAAAVDQMKALNAKAEAEDRDFTPEEQASFNELKAKADSLKARAARAQEQELLEAGLSREPAPAAAGAQPADGGRSVVIPGARILGTENNADRDEQRGFATIGEFARSVFGAANAQRTGQPGTMDNRLAPLAAAPGTYGSEGSGSDGGFVVPPGFSRTLMTLALEEQSLLSLCDDMPVEGNSMALPKDETTPWGTNGVRAYWQGEAQAATATKPVFGRAELRLKKLLALVPMSDELMADATALNAYLPTNMARSIRWKSDEAILFGTGAGQPLGAYSSAARIVVPEDSGQAVNTLSALNLANMVARLTPGSYGRSVWLLNNDVLPALFTLTLGGYPIYLPAGAPVGGITGSPYGSLMGRPIIVTQHAKSFSSEGDVMLADFSHYQAITKAGGIQTATSMHLYFDADAVAFRATFRMDGQPKLAAPVNPQNGANTLSPFVALGART
jgi:HK97 family phage major capsid protein